MLRKSVIWILLLLLLPSSLQARNRTRQATNRARIFGRLPYAPERVCNVPVIIDVGMYVEILDVEDLSIKLQQVEFETYQGCTEIKIKTNFDLQMLCDIKPTGLLPGKYSCWIDNPKVPFDFSERPAVRNVCVKAEEVQILHSAPGLDVHVADVTITVMPEL
jgi:hypothetical protein